MEFKELYNFSLEEEKEVKKTHTRKNKKGEETTVTKTVTEKVPVQVRIKRPSRRELEEDDAKNYSKLLKEILEIQNKYARLELVDKKTDEQKKELEKLKEKLAESKKAVIDAESSMQSLFDHTADIKAQNRLLLWYSLMLTYVQTEKDDDPVPYFEGQSFEDKIESYYLKEEEPSDFYNDLVKKVTTVLAFWFFNQASTPEEFKQLIEGVEKGDL